MRRQDGRYQFVGSNKTINLDKDEEIYFLANDDPNPTNFSDNRGELRIEWLKHK